jgi:diacylglycerol O-acyltransferase / trehalose O-mycolyltransferase
MRARRAVSMLIVMRIIGFLIPALVSVVVLAGPVTPVTARGRAPVVTAERSVGERLVDVTIDSPALGGPATVRLLTPDGWDDRGPRDRWPVLYLLHGLFGSHADWTEQSDVEIVPALRDVLVVMPDAGNGYYSNWWNGGRYGAPAWERFHLDEVRSIVESRYGGGVRRAVAGLSMGGYGALAYAARRPGMFRAVASYSGQVHQLHPDSVAQWRQVYESEDGAVFRNLWGDPVTQRTIWQRTIWQRHDPYWLADRLRRIPVFLACGDGHPGPLDPVGEPYDEIEAFDRVLNESLVVRLRAVGVAVTTHLYSGTHSAPYWERELHRSLPMLLGAVR